MSEQIEGVPEGWRLVRISKWPKVGEYAIYSPGEVVMVAEPDQWELACIVEKIEQPKQYRPFANAKEFAPHRDRWWRVREESEFYQRTTYYSDDFNSGQDWKTCFDERVFDDGSPFGIECEE